MSDPADLFAPFPDEPDPEPAPPPRGARCEGCAQFVATTRGEGWGVCVPRGYRKPEHHACPEWEPAP